MLEIGDDGELEVGQLSARGMKKDGGMGNMVETPVTQASNKSGFNQDGSKGTDANAKSAAQVSVTKKPSSFNLLLTTGHAFDIVLGRFRKEYVGC